MEDNRLCPMTKMGCMGEMCAWYSAAYEDCAVLLNAESVTELSAAEDDGGIRAVIYRGD